MQFILEQGSFRLERNEIYKMVSGYLVREMKSLEKVVNYLEIELDM